MKKIKDEERRKKTMIRHLKNHIRLYKKDKDFKDFVKYYFQYF